MEISSVISFIHFQSKDRAQYVKHVIKSSYQAVQAQYSYRHINVITIKESAYQVSRHVYKQ